MFYRIFMLKIVSYGEGSLCFGCMHFERILLIHVDGKDFVMRKKLRTSLTSIVMHCNGMSDNG